MPDRPADRRKTLLALALETCSDVRICNLVVDHLLPTLDTSRPWTDEVLRTIRVQLEREIKNVVGQECYRIFSQELLDWARRVRRLPDCLANEARHHALETWLIRNEFSCSCLPTNNRRWLEIRAYLRRTLINFVNDEGRRHLFLVTTKDLERDRLEPRAGEEWADLWDHLKADVRRTWKELPPSILVRFNEVLYSDSKRDEVALRQGVSLDQLNKSMSRGVKIIFKAQPVERQWQLARHLRARDLPHRSEDETAELRLLELLCRHACKRLDSQLELEAQHRNELLPAEFQNAVLTWIESRGPLRMLAEDVAKPASEGAKRMAVSLWNDECDFAKAVIHSFDRRKRPSRTGAYPLRVWCVVDFVPVLRKTRPGRAS